MHRSLTPDLKALAEPIEVVLEPLGFRREEFEDKGSLYVICAWGTEAVLVKATFEPRENWGSLVLARRLPPDAWGSLPSAPGRSVAWTQQPHWTMVDTSEILRARGVEPRVSPQQSWPGHGAGQIRKWAELAARDLDLLQDMLRGENLGRLEDMIERRPRRGVPGLDFPFRARHAPRGTTRPSDSGLADPRESGGE